MPQKWFIAALLAASMAGTPRFAATQDSLPLPGCKAPPKLEKILHDKLGGPDFEKLPYNERNALTPLVATELMKQFPREIQPWQRLIGNARMQSALKPELLAKLQAALQQRVKENPNDPLMLYLAATALRDKDTPESIALDNKAIALAPSFPWPYAYLTAIYSSGKAMDKNKERENLRKFWGLCPTSTDATMRWLLVKDMDLQAKVATAERAYLAKATDPSVLKNYKFLWQLEFRLTSPADYPEERKRVAADLVRLEKANPKPDANWAAFLIDGYKQSGATQETITARQDALLKAYPGSEEALSIVESRWRDAHPKPTDQNDVAGWKKWRAANRAAVDQWLHEFPDAHNELVEEAFFATNGDDSLSEADGLAVMNAFVNDLTNNWGPQSFIDLYAGEFLLDHHWEPARALDLLKQAQDLYAKSDATESANDDRSQKDIDDTAKYHWRRDNELDGDLLLAATRAHQPDAVASIKAEVNGPAPKDQENLSDYWQNRARLAVLEDRKADGLAYYRMALDTRLEPPKMSEGILKDPLGDESRALWKDLGGSESAWNAWSRGISKPAANADEARWEKPSQPLPDFSLADLTGKTWKLADLHGKVTLINLWATWCAPCQAELPHLEKLYEQVKGRSDIQILTFDIDEDPGLVGPFLKKKGYTFPVLPAYSYTVNLLNGYAIPQNWLLNPKGVWLWTQVGYDGEDSWQKDMLAKMTSIKSGQ